MGSECYQVDILHFINPHLIWVEAKTESKNEFVFEQVGIYGVVPLETAIDITEMRVKTQRSDEWMPAAAASLVKLFGKAKQVWFLPTHIDQRTTIFDDNIFKFGELIILQHDGLQTKVSKTLIDENLALFDVCLFHQELSNGNLKTKLTPVQTKEVIRQLDKFYLKKNKKDVFLKSFEKHTQVYQTAQDIENLLTIANLEKHNLQENTKHIMSQKMKDLELCKGVEDESVGRAVKKSSEKPSKNSVLKKRLKMIKNAEAFNVTKSFIDKHAVKKETQSFNDTDLQITCKSVKKPGKEEVVETTNVVESELKRSKSTASKNDFATSPNLQDFDASFKPQKPVGVKLIAYGPPGLDKTLLPAKPQATIEEMLTGDDTKLEENDYCKVARDNSSFKNDDIDFQSEQHAIPKVKINSPKAKVNIVSSPNIIESSDKTENVTKSSQNKLKSNFLLRKIRIHKSKELQDTSLTSGSETTNKDTSSSEANYSKEDESDNRELEDLIKKLNEEYKPKTVEQTTDVTSTQLKKPLPKNNVNPFKNVEANMSVFVDKLVTAVLMVHNKMNKRIEPRCELREVPFNSHIQVVLKNLRIQRPMTLQTVSWITILRGHSLFMISPLGSGKTLGYLPAVCRLVTDSQVESVSRIGPVAIIVCATSKSVSDVERISKMCLGLKEKVLACYAGMDEFHITTSLLNGCDLLICTPSILFRLLQLTDFGVDLRRLATFVLDDCERLDEEYSKEIKFFFLKIKEMLKNRVNKALKVQYVLASRTWCDFMEPLAKKVPDTVISIGAFQECLIYAKTPTSVKFTSKDSKNQAVLDFLKEIDISKRIVIVCRNDEEVKLLENTLSKTEHTVFATNHNMTLHDLYNLNMALADYQDPVVGPILLCCDFNLVHLNVTDAHYLLHYSLPQLFSQFCKRFSVLNDNYASIFNTENEITKVLILIDDTNVEQLPKIVNFIKRCTDELPESLEETCKKVLTEKDLDKANNYVPLCDNLLALGECPDFWNCQERHAVHKHVDEPKKWMPKNGLITFKVLHYHTAALYSARLISNIDNGKVTKYPQTYSTLSLKMGNYYSKESNKRPHGKPNVGDVCAVSLEQNFFTRCQIMKILSRYPNGTPNYLLVKLIDEEKYEKSQDINLYHLPDELKNIETHVVQVRLANIRPKDKDITFSELAHNQLKKITDEDEELYLRGKVSLTIGNCVFVETLEACQSLKSLNEIVLKHDFRKELLQAHANIATEHLSTLQSLSSDIAHVEITDQEVQLSDEDHNGAIKVKVRPQWAHLERDDFSTIYFASAVSPGKFFVRLTHFEDCMNNLLKDIKSYIAENPNPVVTAHIGDIVLAKFPDDGTFERARIDKVFDSKVQCFFVDQGDWRDIPMRDLIPINEKLITQLPFQAIECRLIGVKPPGDDWTDFSTNWFCDQCYEDNHEYLKNLNIKYFVKEEAESVGGYKYGVILIDTTGAEDVVINQLLMDVNLAIEDDNEISFLKEVNFERCVSKKSEEIDEDEWEKISNTNKEDTILAPNNSSLATVTPANLLLRQPTRSMPLVADDESSEDDKWDTNMVSEFLNSLKPVAKQSVDETSQTKNVEKQSPLPTAEKPALPKLRNEQNIYNKEKPDPINSPRLRNEQKINNKDIPDKINSPKLRKEQIIDKKEIPDTINASLDSDDLSAPENSELSDLGFKPTLTPALDEVRKPKLVWRQSKTNLTVKIQLICVKYTLDIQQNNLKFSATANDVEYSFDLILYGALNLPKCRHANKGQYILVSLVKIMPRNWLTLTKDGVLKKWILYDVDSIDTSSDEEEVNREDLVNVVRNMHNKEESDSDYDEFVDDINFTYRK